MPIHHVHQPLPTDTPFRLGRHIQHDSRSRDFAFPEPETVTRVTTIWPTSAPVLDQGNTNSCTGNAITQLLDCDMFAPVRQAKGHKYLNEGAAMHFYGLGTHLDGCGPDQYYPPNDQGCDGLSVTKAAQQLGYVDKYLHCFTWAQVQAALQTQPVIAGVSWTQAMFTCRSNGFVYPGPINSVTVQGGHEFCIRGIDYQTQSVICRNSWGASWGGGPGIEPGEFRLTFYDLKSLLAELP